jgi:hypothetical protein
MSARPGGHAPGARLTASRHVADSAAGAVSLRYGGIDPAPFPGLPNPDGLGAWAEPGRQVTFWLEYDTGTENLSRLAGKLEGYGILAAGLADAGDACPPLLFCLPGPRREQSARRALAGCPDAAKLRIATAAIDPRATCPAGPVWLPLGAASAGINAADADTRPSAGANAGTRPSPMA